DRARRRRRDNRRYDSRPCSVSSRVDIGVGRVSAGTAKELALRLAICPFDMPTSRAALAGVFRVYQDDRNPSKARLVFDKLPQLGKTPIAVPRSFILASNPCPRADMRQIFQRNPSVRRSEEHTSELQSRDNL